MLKFRIGLLAALIATIYVASPQLSWAQADGADGKPPADKAGPVPSGADAAAAPTGKAKAPAGPSAADMEKAKEQFIKGRELFDANDFTGAVSAFKESYRLSRNALLLYNIG